MRAGQATAGLERADWEDLTGYHPPALQFGLDEQENLAGYHPQSLMFGMGDDDDQEGCNPPALQFGMHEDCGCGGGCGREEGCGCGGDERIAEGFEHDPFRLAGVRVQTANRKVREETDSGGSSTRGGDGGGGSSSGGGGSSSDENSSVDLYVPALTFGNTCEGWEDHGYFCAPSSSESTGDSDLESDDIELIKTAYDVLNDYKSYVERFFSLHGGGANPGCILDRVGEAHS